ncbi:MAG: hypothetical protein H6Q52_1219 [Deltaproteobacteria bacterium]|nr:hypothetical protein [Deltaproteobacteria bacterium]
MAAKKTRKPVENVHSDQMRMRRFLFLWVPIICLVLIGVYASALDPPRPTGRLIKGSVIEIKKSSQQAMSVLYKIKLETGEDIEVAVSETNKPAGSEVMVEEYSTVLLKKKSYEIQQTSVK